MDIARHWRLKKHRYALQNGTEEAQQLLAVVGPSVNGNRPRPQQEEHATELNRVSGEVYSFTRVFDAPEGYQEFAPYTIALIKLEDGAMVTAQLTDLGEDEAQIGMPVEMVTRKLRSTNDERGMLVYGYKFRPSVQSTLA